ncbi:ATP-binding protein [Fluviispira vulneris]|uniref:ATP-binding protein n=1 Tax=Fluviispira vulneris TaxID=2763012 RepID=UPI001645B493|nr:ATP-binding protein [Fluviispira vulneris]
MLKNKTTLILILVTVLASLGTILLLFINYFKEINNLKSVYKIEKQEQVNEVKRNIEMRFNYFYQALRTISFIPNVKNLMEGQVQKLSNDTLSVIHEIYNNAYYNVQMSEIYITPKKLDPDQIDAKTKKPQSPLFTLDNNITGITSVNAGKKDKIEEIEIFEYRVMKEQLKFLNEKYPVLKSSKEVNVPAILSKDIVTCDNSEFSLADLKAKNDYNRLGIVYTVPSYNKNNKFIGAVSGVLRKKIIADSLPEKYFKLVNLNYGFAADNKAINQLLESEQYFKNNLVNPNIILNGSVDLKIRDDSVWKLWYAFPNEEFWSRNDVSSAKKLLIFGNILIILFATGIIFKLIGSLKYQKELEQEIQERTYSLKTKNQDMQLILDKASEGYLIIDTNGNITLEHSIILDKWFGSFAEGTKIWDYLSQGNKIWRESFINAFEQIINESIPIELALDQIPKFISVNNFHYELSISPIYNDNNDLIKFFCVILNNTVNREMDRIEVINNEKMRIFKNLINNKEDFIEIINEANNLVSLITEETSPEELKRIFQLLKENCMTLGIFTFAELCQNWLDDINTFNSENKGENCKKFCELWSRKMQDVKLLIGEQNSQLVKIDKNELYHALKSVRMGATQNEIENLLLSLSLEPISIRLNRLSKLCKQIAEKYNKNINIQVYANEFRVDSNYLADFWRTLIIVLHYVIHFNIEHPDERVQLKKSENGLISIEAAMQNNEFILKIKDDGKGIDLLEKQYNAFSLVEQVCINKGGKFEIENIPNQGTLYIFKIQIKDTVNIG